MSPTAAPSVSPALAADIRHAVRCRLHKKKVLCQRRNCLKMKSALTVAFAHAPCALPGCRTCKLREVWRAACGALPRRAPMTAEEVRELVCQHVKRCPDGGACTICTTVRKRLEAHRRCASSRPSIERGRDEEVRTALRANEAAPAPLCCPITCEVMASPVTTILCVHTFEEAAIRRWLCSKSTCPACRVPMTVKDLMPDDRAVVRVKEWEAVCGACE